MGSLMSFPVISSLIMHILVTLAMQIIGVLVVLKCNDFVPLDPYDEDYQTHIYSYEMTTVFVTSIVSYIVSGFVIHAKDKFLEPFFKNIPYVLG